MEPSSNFIKLISLSWDKAALSFYLNSYAFLEIGCSGGGKSLKLKIAEADNIGRIPISGLCPAANYKLTVKWNWGKSVLEFKTLPKLSGKLLSSYAVLADPHVSEMKGNRKGRLFVEAGLILEGIIDECNGQELDFILIAGDLTNCGTQREYDEVKRILNKSKCPVSAVPGDHDLAADGIRRWRAFFGPEQWIKDIKEYRIAGVNTGGNMLDAGGRKLVAGIKDSGLFPVILTHVQLLPNDKIKYGAKSRPVDNYGKVKKYIREILTVPSMIYAGHQNIPARVTVGRTVQINLPQPCQYICGYYVVKHFENGFYHMFMPIRSEILRQYSRLAAELTAVFYHEKQWGSAYREGGDISESNFVISG